MNSSLLVTLWAVISLTALAIGPQFPLSAQVWLATSMAGVAGIVCFLRLIYE